MSDEDILPGDTILVIVIHERTHSGIHRKLRVIDRADASIEEAEGITYKRYIAEDAAGRR